MRTKTYVLLFATFGWLMITAVVFSQSPFTNLEPPVITRPGRAITPTPSTTPTATAKAQPLLPCQAIQPVPDGDQSQFMPFMSAAFELAPPLPPPTLLSSSPPIDFNEVRTELQEQGLALAFNKIGFHTGYGGNTTGLRDMLTQLDSHCVPFFLKSVDDAGHLYFAQQLKQKSGAPHILIWRRTGLLFEVPNYNLPPAQAAQEHWQLHKSVFPPELDPSQIWIETMNEVDKERSEWLAEFAIEMARLTIADGFNWAAFSWSSGTPEPEAWEEPKMLEFLALVGQYPDRLAIALHEYSFQVESISEGYPYLVGRFQKLFRATDAHHIPRPTILITEWGWAPKSVPTPAEALADIRWAGRLYAAYPQVKGAAIWYLGCCFDPVADETQRLIAPVGDYSISHYFAITPGTGQIDESIFISNPPTQ